MPRIFTPPLRELTPETSLGFEVIAFAIEIMGVTLYPWQEEFLIRALELLPDGRYRFRRVFCLVARQNGKSLLAAVLAAWWLFVDSDRYPHRLPPVRFKILGTAQNLDTAREVWANVRRMCDPKVDPDEDMDVIPALAAAVRKVSDTNGEEAILLRSKAHYEIRAANRKGGRGKSGARVLMDELREQTDWFAWDSLADTTKSIFNSQLYGFSNAGDARSVVLAHQRTTALELIDAWTEYVDSGIQSIEDFANGHDLTFGWFEWSAPDGCAMDDVDAILQANPSIGHGELTVEAVLADIGGRPETSFRTEVLCQWVTVMVKPEMDPADWIACADPVTDVDADGEPLDGTYIPEGQRVVAGIDMAGRDWTYIGIAGLRADGLMHGEVVAQRPGNLWVVGVMRTLRELWGITEVALQTRGCHAAELKEPLERAGFRVIEVAGPALGAATGKTLDRVRSRTVRHVSQPSLDLAASVATVRGLNDVVVWDRSATPVMNSQVNQASPYETFQLLMGQARRDFIAAHTADSYYVGVWLRLTRPGAAGYSAPTFVSGIRKGSAISDLNVAVGIASDQAWTTPSETSAATRHAASRRSNRNGAIFAGAAATTGFGSAFVQSTSAMLLGAAMASAVNKLPSFITYRAYYEDLTISGRSAGSIAQRDLEEFQAHVESFGGRAYGDTWSNPATVTP